MGYLLPLTTTACLLIWFHSSAGGRYCRARLDYLWSSCAIPRFIARTLSWEWSWLVQDCALRLRFLPRFHLKDLISKSDKSFWSLYSWVWFQPLEGFFLAISWKETKPTTKTARRRGPAAMIRNAMNPMVTNSTSLKPLTSLKRTLAHQSWEKTWGELTLS